MSPITVVPYDPKWPLVFATLRETIWNAVGDVALRIEHVGSTSVPGLAAKPVIDLDVVVHLADVPTSLARLEGIGYRPLGDLGIPQREALKPPPSAVPHNLYVCPSTSPALKNHLAVRDYLRANPEAASAYGELKKRLAILYPEDMEGYVEAKSDFLAEVLRQAGFEQAGIEEIRRLNRRRGAGEPSARQYPPKPAKTN
ncbi:MAG TPA: GrpB family protein [Thermoanaerobaculia bacterium]|nr:GrpB family protein [Thermoanaerobaculia bacterium]